MKKYLVSYSTKEYRMSHMLLNFTARLFGVDKCISYTEEEFKKTEFYTSNISILKDKRGAGHWLWKYYVISEALKQVNTNDILIYCDAGLLVKKTTKPLIKLVIENDGILLFNQNQLNKYWVKRDCFVELNCDNEPYYNSLHIVGNVQLFQKNEKSISFVKEVLEMSVKNDLITDRPNRYGYPNLNEFIEHKSDQSITSLIAHKYKLKLYPDPTPNRVKNVIYQFPDEIPLETEFYKSIFYIHRLKNKEIVKLPFIIFMEFFKKKLRFKNA